MSQEAAIMFEFPDGRSAVLAHDLLKELGYDPVMHGESRMHIHVDGGDLTSALEIAQAHGGRLVEHAAIAEEAITNTAYSLDAITIPAHLVNEDWIGAEEEAGHNRDSDEAEYRQAFVPDAETYNHFSGDVHT